MTRRGGLRLFAEMALLAAACLASPPAIRAQASTESAAVQSGTAWEMKANPALKGKTGRILVKVPTKASMIFQVFKSGEQDPYKHIAAWYESGAGNFMPGTYDVKIWSALVNGVPVERGKDTRILVGVLHLNLDGVYEVYDESKSTKVFGGHAKEKNKIVLPFGRYHVKVSDDFGEITIKDGATTEF